ncbi:MAG TPA: hypothetical protein VF143_08835 [Candidatus Nanopelagicales bacterium]
MSEQILERSATSASGMPSAGTNPAAVAAPAKGGRRRTLVVVLLAIVGGVLLGGLALLMLGGSGEDETALAPVPRGNPAAAAADVPVEAAAPAEVPAASTTRLTSRDPFAPLIPKKAAPAPAPAAPAAAPAGAASSSTAAAPVASTPTPAKGGTISALSISPLGNSATLKLDGKKYTVEEGEAFATSYRLYDIFNQDCAGFLYGDRNAVVCKGDSVAIG